MTVGQVIASVDAQRPGNVYMTDEKVKWLSDIESVIYHEVVQTHENPDEITFDGYTEGSDMASELIADDLYSDLYVYYVLAQVDRATQENAKYNVDMSLFNAMYAQFVARWNRTHLPLQPHKLHMGWGCCGCSSQ